MSDDLWLSLPRVAATPKKNPPEPRPQEPMRAQIKGPRRNPSTDQKKDRRLRARQPQRKGAADRDAEQSRQSIGSTALPAAEPDSSNLAAIIQRAPSDGGLSYNPMKDESAYSWYHGTLSGDLHVGDILRPGIEIGSFNFEHATVTKWRKRGEPRQPGEPATGPVSYQEQFITNDLVWMTTSKDIAWRWTSYLLTKGKVGTPTVYRVEPIGDVWEGPNSNKIGGGGEFGAKGARIIEKYTEQPSGTAYQTAAKVAAWGEIKDYWDRSSGEPVWTQPRDELLADALHSWKGDPSSVRTHIIYAIEHAPQPDSGSGKIMRAWAEVLLDEVRKAPHVPVKLYRGEIMRSMPVVGERIEWLLRGAAPKRSTAKAFAKEDPYAHDTEVGVLRIITDTTGLHIADYNIGSGLDQIEDEYLLIGTFETIAVDDTKKPVEATMRQVSKTTSKWSKVSALTTKEWPGEVGNGSHITMEENGTVPTAAVASLLGVNGETPGAHRNRQGNRWEQFKADIAANGITDPIFITVDWGGVPKISEGNHRRDAAVEAGLDEVPVQIRYFGHAEQQGTLLMRVGKTASWMDDNAIIVGDGSGIVGGSGNWRELEPGGWLMANDYGVSIAYDRAAMGPEMAARFDAKWPGKKFAWQRQFYQSWDYPNREGTASSLEAAKQKATEAGQKEYDEGTAKDLARNRKLFGPTYGTPEYQKTASSIEIKIGDWILNAIIEATAWQDGKVVGAIEVAKPYYRVEKIYVRPSHRRQGIATMLVRALEQHLGRELPPGDEMSPSGAAWASSLTGKEYYDTWGQDGQWEGWLDRIEKGGARSASLRTDIEALRPELAAAVQRVVDEWEPSDEGFDEEYGYGGACDNAADAMMTVLGDHGIDTASGGQEGDDHAWVVALRGDEVVGVDVPPGVYETGGGYSWRKLPDASISPRQVEVWDLDVPAENFREGAKTLDEAIHELADVILKAPPSSGEGYSIWGEKPERVDPDWKGVLGRVKTMYRGYGIRVRDDEYEMLFGTGRSNDDKAEYLLELIGKRGLGTHWTTHRGEAAGFAGMTADRGDVRVMVWADPPRPEDVLIGEGTKGMGIQAWDDTYGEQEIPIRAGAPIHIKRIEWAKGGARPMLRSDDGGGWDWTKELSATKAAKVSIRFEPGQMASWPSTKPWNLSQADAEAQLVPGWWFKSARGSESASWEKGYIRPSPEFFGHPEQARRAIAYHEAGHAMIEAAGGISSIPDPLSIITLPGADILGYNAEEIVAEAYSVLWTEPAWFERAQARAVRDLTIDLAKRAGYPLPSTSRSAILHTAALAVPVVNWKPDPGGHGGTGTVSRDHGPVIVYRGFGSWGEAKDSLRRGEWISSGMFTVRGEGDTQMALKLDDVLASAGVHRLRGTGFLGYIEADVSGLPFATFRTIDVEPNDHTRGSFEPDTGLGIGIVGGIPLDRISKVVAIDEDGKQTPMTVQGLRNSIDKLQDRADWQPQVKYLPETHKIVVIWTKSARLYHHATSNQNGAECGEPMGYDPQTALVRQGELMERKGKTPVANLWWNGTVDNLPQWPCSLCFDWAIGRAAAKVAAAEPVKGIEHAMHLWRNSFGGSNMIAQAAAGEVTEEPYLSAARMILDGIASSPVRRYAMRVDHRLPSVGDVIDIPLFSAAASTEGASGYETFSNSFGLGEPRGIWYELLDLPALAFDDGREYICSGKFRVKSVRDWKAPWEGKPGSFVPLAGKRKMVSMEYVGPSSKTISHTAMAVPLFKGTERNMSERNVLAAANRLLADIAREYGYRGELPAVEITAEPYELGSAAARSLDITDRNRDLWPNGCILLDRSLVERAQDKELGYTEFRIIAHEAIHALVQRNEPSYPGYSQMITEGGAEVLSVAYWAKSAPGFDDRDAVRINGKWVPGDIALVHGMNYKDWVRELMVRTASKVGWNIEAILREVQRVVAGNTTVKLDFRDTSNPNFSPPPGVENTAEGLMLWLIGQITDRAPHSRFGALSLEAVISVAEETMERAGLAGKTLHIPTGHADDPSYQKALAPYVQMVSEWCGRPIRFYANDYILDTDGGGAQALTDGMNKIVVRPTTTEMTILHEAAHVMLHEAESYGHTPEFVSTVEQLYRDHLGDAAADQFMLIVGDYV